MVAVIASYNTKNTAWAGGPTVQSTSLQESPEGPARKYYALTERGRQACREMNACRDLMKRGIDRWTFWPFAEWFERRHGIRIALTGLVAAVLTGIALAAAL